MDLILVRTKTSDQGTQGAINLPGLTVLTLELPWRADQHDLSCIPPDVQYPFVKRNSPHFGCDLWHIENVIGSDGQPRSNTMCHNGNFAGDVRLGFKSDVLGCILIGDTFSNGVPDVYKQPQLMLQNSKATLVLFMAKMDTLAGPHTFKAVYL